MVSIDSIGNMLTLAVLNNVELLACGIQTLYLTTKCRKNIYTIAGPEFDSEEDTLMIVKMVVYGLKITGVAFRLKLDGVLYGELDYRPSIADPDV